MSGRISTDDLTDEQIEAVLNTKGFQKMLAYSRLADGIDVLEDEDEIFESMVNTITKQHSSVSTFTEPLVEDDDGMESADLEELYVDDGGDR